MRRDERTMNMHGQNLMNPYPSQVNPYQSQFMHMNYPPAPLTPEQLHQQLLFMQQQIFILQQ